MINPIQILVAVFLILALGRTPSAAELKDWRLDLPEGIREKIDGDIANLLRKMGYNLDRTATRDEKPASIRVSGLNLSNFDDDGKEDWQIHVGTSDSSGRRIQGTLIYDICDGEWECVAALRGLFPVGWGKLVRGRMGIWTREPAPEFGVGADKIRYYRFDGGKYVDDHVEIESGG